VIAASAIAAMVAGSECDNSKYEPRAADTRPLRQASKIGSPQELVKTLKYQ
jgi:hypothetical protein